MKGFPIGTYILQTQQNKIMIYVNIYIYIYIEGERESTVCNLYGHYNNQCPRIVNGD